MRYFVYLVPIQLLKQIDIENDTNVQQMIDALKREFGLKENIDENQSGTSIVLSYNGADLKPTWLIDDLNIPAGAIIHCLYREKRTADFYVHCGFNNTTLEFFDKTITVDTTIGEIRKRISNRIGLPLSTFCLEICNSEQRLYDQMKLYQYGLKPNGHVYLKVLYGYEKFLNLCIKGLPKYHSHDELIRDYELQIGLHIAAFYGYLGMAQTALLMGAQSETPVGVHPSRQWSGEAAVDEMPELLKCPIHIAVEQGHMKIVDLFVQQSIFCTQVLHPITGYLPYRMALALSMSAKTTSEKERFSEIYLYLHDKQYNLRIPLNSNSTNKGFQRSQTNVAYFSLPRYCKIIRWCEKGRERAWRKYGHSVDRSIDIKRGHRSRGVLGYKVLIDGFSNDAENVNENKKIIHRHRFIGCDDAERQKIMKMETFMKQVSHDERQQRSKFGSNTNLQRSRNQPILVQRNFFGEKTRKADVAPPTSIAITCKDSSVQPLHEEATSIVMCPPHPSPNDAHENNAFSIIDKTSSLEPNQNKYPQPQQRESKLNNKLNVSLEKISSISLISEKNENMGQENSFLPSISKFFTKQKQNSDVPREITSSADAYAFVVDRFILEEQQRKLAAKQQLLTEIEDASKGSADLSTINTEFSSLRRIPNKVPPMTPLPLPENRIKPLSFARTRYDSENQQEIIKSYENFVNESTRITAIDCLQEIGFLKRKSWIQKVEMSKGMMRQRTKRRITPINDNRKHSILLPIQIETQTK